MNEKIPKIVTKQELANYLGVSVQTITRYQSNGMPIAFKLGKRWPRYDLHACLDWLKSESKENGGTI